MSEDKVDGLERALQAVVKLTALEERSAELRRTLERIEGRIESLVERVAQLEGSRDQVAGDLRSEIRHAVADELAGARRSADDLQRYPLIAVGREESDAEGPSPGRGDAEADRGRDERAARPSAELAGSDDREQAQPVPVRNR